MKNLPKCNRTNEAFKEKFQWLASTMMVVVDQNNNQVASDCLILKKIIQVFLSMQHQF